MRLVRRPNVPRWRTLGLLGGLAGTLVAISVGAAFPASETLPLGTVSPARGSDAACPSGSKCETVSVRCPGVNLPARASLAVVKPGGRIRGVALFFSGGYGTGYWGGGGKRGGQGGRESRRRPAAEFLQTLSKAGIETVQVRWLDSWLVSAAGERVGPARLACRSASVVRYAYDKLYRPLKLKKPTSSCGFCITGSSGGATQVSYALAFYGLDSILDVVAPTGGPPHAAIAKGCLGQEEAYAFPAWAAGVMDASYGYAKGEQGPCGLRDRAFLPRWEADAVDTGGNDYVHAKTRIVIILGGRDRSVAPPHARDYAARLQAAGNPLFKLVVVPNLPHGITGSPEGLAALRQALLR